MKKSLTATYSYYPGCSQVATNKAYDISTRHLARALGFNLVELEDWNCCGATAYVAVRELRSFVLSVRNLALAEAAGHDLVTPCSGCYLVLRKTQKYFAESPSRRKQMSQALAAGGMTYRGTVRVRHFLELVVREAGEESVRSRVVKPLEGLRVACYYGCQVTRPFAEIDDEESPEVLDNLVRWLGGKPVHYPLKTKCCGGLMMTTQPEIGKKLTGELLKNAKQSGADCIVTCCPLCQMNLDSYQSSVSAAMSTECTIPVLYFTQLTGYALGLSGKTLALSDSISPVGQVCRA